MSSQSNNNSNNSKKRKTRTNNNDHSNNNLFGLLSIGKPTQPILVITVIVSVLVIVLFIGTTIYSIQILDGTQSIQLTREESFFLSSSNTILHRLRRSKNDSIVNLTQNQQQQQQQQHDTNNNKNTTSTILKRTNGSTKSTKATTFPPPYPFVTRNDPLSNEVLLSPEAIAMCTNTLWHTIETTTIVLPNVETFVHTGDIDDLWLRDSAAQIHPLMVPNMVPNNDGTSYLSLVQSDAKLNRIVAGLIQRHVQYIHHDPYANAFRIDDTYVFNEEQKRMGRHDLISTWNYELDSGCYTLRMIYYYYQNFIVHPPQPQQQSADTNTDYTFVLQKAELVNAIEIMIDLWIAEQQHENDLYPTTPGLDQTCKNCGKPYRYPGLQRNGKGTPTNATSGLTWTGFRPSDDECIFGYLIPANMFLIAVLEYVLEMLSDEEHMWTTIPTATKNRIYKKAYTLQQDVIRGIQQHAIIEHDIYGPIYAYEVDGLGNYNLMDDANVPSLLSIPYLLGAYPHHYNTTVYENTKKFILSNDNPYYHSGNNPLTGPVAGIGSPHMEQRIHDNIWPMSLAIQGLISTNITEKITIVETLVQASAGTHWMHESFNVQNPNQFTRSWFCWSDSLFAELVMTLTPHCPLPSKKYKVLQWRDPITVPGSIYAMD